MSFPLRRAAQAFRSRPGTPRRTYAALAGHLAEKPSRASDVGWIVSRTPRYVHRSRMHVADGGLLRLVWLEQLAAAAVFVPTMGYLMSPRAAQHSSTSHAHPVEDRWTRSFALEHLDASKLNRPIMAADDGIVPAGEGRPHGPGDKSIRQITKPTESHAGHQVSMQKDTEHIRGSSGKMEHARALSAQRGSEATTIDTKAVQAHAATDRQEKLAASPS